MAPNAVASAEDVLRMLRVAREVVIAPHLATYAVRLVLGTHRRRCGSTCAMARRRAAYKRWSPGRRCARSCKIASMCRAMTCRPW